LKIVVTVKQIPDPNGAHKLTADNRLARDGEVVLDPGDEYGIEAALRIKEASGDAEVVLVSMGPAKAALEAIGRYLARDLGPRHVRVNTVSAGPLETIAARSIPGFSTLKDAWSGQAPLGWDATDAGPVADAAVFLLSDMARGISGEVIHVDGGYHSQGAPLFARPKQQGET